MSLTPGNLRVRAAGLLGVGCVVSLLGCGAPEHPPRLFDDHDASSVALDSAVGGFDVAPDVATLSCSAGEEAGIVCACREIAQVPPTLYILFDVSGSMSQRVGAAAETKWEQIRYALLREPGGVLRPLGGRLGIGAAVFPGPGAGCNPGNEVFPVTVGSPVAYDDLANRLRVILPDGATPTAHSIHVLAGGLEARKGPVYLLLATDGAPNCGSAPCSADRCSYDIEGARLTDGTPCTPPLNCCDPAKVPGGMGWGACVDSAATLAEVTALHTAGVTTFVVGVPGTEAYASDLDALAVAGGAPRALSPRYYAATDATSLADGLRAIAGKVVSSCTITLDAPVDDPGVTNVLLDGTLVPQDPTNGWTFSDREHIELHGTACQRVTDGVGRLQVAVGCKTITR